MVPVVRKVARALCRPLSRWSGLAAGLALVVALAGPVPPAAAQRAQAPDPVAQADPADRARYDSAFKAMIADPANLDKTFAYAKAAIEVADYEGAIAALERMLFINPDLPRVRLELGALYFRLGSYEAARSYLTTALQAPDVPADVRSRVDAFLAEIDERLSQHRFSGGIYAGLRFQSNATSAPGGTGVRALGFDATLDQEYTSKADTNLFVVGNAKHNYLLQSLAGASIESTALLYYARQHKERRVDLNVLELTSGPRLPLDVPGLFDDGSLYGYAVGTYVELGGDRYYSGLGGGMELRALPAEWTNIRLTAESRAKQYHSNSVRPRNDQQTGFTSSVSLRLRQGLTENLVVNGLLAAARNETDYDYNDYTEYAVGIGLDYLFQPGFVTDLVAGELPKDLPWATSISVSRVLTGYGGPDPSVDPGTTRQDHDWRLSAITAVPISQSWTGILSLGRTQRTSSLPNYQYTNTSVSLGASWRF